ncbi:MAG: hypothetical protein A2007_06490 [Verrucomicrobia bacterium GWC2_42_7]|nr:MAG: hypothetical protein A2007_06490 [Verrucomicrobia bacterium GWC2_42_7]
MTPKERVRIAMAKKQPDRLPASVSFNTDTKSGPIKTGGLSAKEKIMQYLQTDDYERVLRRLYIDVRNLGPRPLKDDPCRDEKFRNFFHGLRKASTIDDLEQLDWPTYDMFSDYSYLRDDLIKILNMDDMYAVAVSGISVWEVAREWRGFDRALMDWVGNPEFTTALFEHLYQMFIGCYDAYEQQLGDMTSQIDYVRAGSDFGIQTGPMINPSLFERDYLVFVKREVERAKKVFPNAFFEFHCCGSAIEFYPYFVRAGVDIHHPVQPGCKDMDFGTIKRDWGYELAFAGGVDAQGVLAHGTPDEVRQMVLYAFNTLGKGGGFMIAPHGIMPEVPLENVLELFDTVEKECRY